VMHDLKSKPDGLRDVMVKAFTEDEKKSEDDRDKGFEIRSICKILTRLNDQDRVRLNKLLNDRHFPADVRDRFLSQLGPDYFQPKDVRFVRLFDELGYGRVIDQWTAPTTSRLEAVFSKMSGNQIRDFFGGLNDKDQARLADMIKSSDLTATTRSRLVA